MTYQQTSPDIPSYPTTICAVIVIHRPTEKFIDILDAVTKEVDKVILVENEVSQPSSVLSPATMEPFGDRLDLLTCEDNNLAKAQNMGIKEAIRQGYAWVMLMDDDSRPQSGMVPAMLNAWQSLPECERKKVAVIAPNIQDKSMDRPDGFMKLRHRIFFYKEHFTATSADKINDILYVPASGSLIPTYIFDEIGYMDEGLNIYFVDTDFCLRINRAGYRIIAIKSARLLHRMGRRSSHKFMGRSFTTTNHPPRARYFMYRNRLKLWRRYVLSFPGYIIFDTLRTIYELLRILTLEDNRATKFQAITRGIRDSATSER